MKVPICSICSQMTAIKTAVVVPTEQGPIGQRKTEAFNDFALNGDDRLYFNARLLAAYALDAAQKRRKWLPDAVSDIASGVGSDCLLCGYPTSWLARKIQLKDALHGLHS